MNDFIKMVIHFVYKEGIKMKYNLLFDRIYDFAIEFHVTLPLVNAS